MVSTERLLRHTCKSQGLLNAHTPSHDADLSKNNCKHCGTMFWTDIQLQYHIQVEHTETETESQYSILNLIFQFSKDNE